MTPMGFEPTISAGERPQTYALVRAATVTSNLCIYVTYICYYCSQMLERCLNCKDLVHTFIL